MQIVCLQFEWPSQIVKAHMVSSIQNLIDRCLSAEQKLCRTLIISRYLYIFLRKPMHWSIGLHTKFQEKGNDIEVRTAVVVFPPLYKIINMGDEMVWDFKHF